MTPVLLQQTRPTNCGQTALAMLAGITIEQAERIYGHKTITHAGEHVTAVRAIGFYPDERGFRRYEGGPLPSLALVRVRFLKRSGGRLSTAGKLKRTGHLVLLFDGVIYDPTGFTYEASYPPPGTIIESVLEVLAP